MLCKNCGKELKESDKFCSKCGMSTNMPNDIDNNLSNNTINKNEEKGIHNCYLAIEIALTPIVFYGLFFRLLKKLSIINIFYIYAIIYIIGLIMVITAKIKNPKSKKISKLMIIYIAIGALIIIAVKLLVGLFEAIFSI